MRKIAVLLGCLAWMAACWTAAGAASPVRSPRDLALGPDDAWLVVIDETADAAVLVSTGDGRVLDDVRVGHRPVAIAATPDRRRVLVSSGYAGEVAILEVSEGRLRNVATLKPGFEPHGIAVTADGHTAYVALAAAHQVAVVDLQTLTIREKFGTGRWPRHLALSRDGRRLAVAASGEGGIAVLDVATHEMLHLHKFRAMNPGVLRAADDGFVYFPWMFYGDSTTTPGNIQRGWVMASRLGRVNLDQVDQRSGISLDPRHHAVSDPYGLDIARDGRRLVISASGTHELLLLARENIPWVGIGGSEHIDGALAADRDRFARIEVGGRPLGLEIAGDSRTVYVANYLLGQVQVVDLDERKLVRSIPLGGEPTQTAQDSSLARQGEAIFYDAKRSLEGWYSCHSCHQDGGGNINVIDTLNDGSTLTYKTVLPLYNVVRTSPWTWHGWQTDLKKSLHNSLTSTMRGPEPSEKDIEALLAFLDTVELPPNPHRLPDGLLSPAAQRGAKVFRSERAGCANCHNGPYLTDGQIHDVGLNRPDDHYQGYNTPSLLGVYRKVRLLHNGRATSLDELLTGPHNPTDITGAGSLTDEERADLIEYLNSL